MYLSLQNEIVVTNEGLRQLNLNKFQEKSKEGGTTFIYVCVWGINERRLHRDSQ